MERKCIVFLQICIQFLIKKKRKKVKLFFKKVLTFPMNGDTITIEIKQERKIGYLGYYHNLERMNSNESKYH